MSADYRRMMQEQLDGELKPEEAALLEDHLAAEPEAAKQQEQLTELHVLLTKPPHEPVPQRLAATIMARLAQQLQQQAELQPMTQEMRLALMASLSVVTMAMMPLMISASYMVLMAQRSPALLGQVSLQVVALMVVMIDAMTLLLDEIEEIIEKDPKMAPVAFYMIPIALNAMLEYLEGNKEVATLDPDHKPKNSKITSLEINRDDDDDDWRQSAFNRLSR